MFKEGNMVAENLHHESFGYELYVSYGVLPISLHGTFNYTHIS